MENASLRSPGSLTHKNLVDPPIAAGVSQGGLESSIHKFEVLDCEDKICGLAGPDSFQDDPLSGSLGSSVALASTIGSLPLACPPFPNQDMQSVSNCLSGEINDSACESVSSLVAIDPALSTDPQACYQIPCREELSRLSPQKTALLIPAVSLFPGGSAIVVAAVFMGSGELCIFWFDVIQSYGCEDAHAEEFRWSQIDLFLHVAEVAVSNFCGVYLMMRCDSTYLRCVFALAEPLAEATLWMVLLGVGAVLGCSAILGPGIIVSSLLVTCRGLSAFPIVAILRGGRFGWREGFCSVDKGGEDIRREGGRSRVEKGGTIGRQAMASDASANSPGWMLHDAQDRWEI
ncbi:hypothetical protein Nepgr_018815 [Nepenthes gracilis]|uniref:Transmembrane protein n=1 Tax=Nepenthes gracilis TaxID=150966 RepID=A0AAD3SU27_NEPGR|nr:hypothetical protein Nepgr_018815 [Nepenthes gracilis]